LQADSRLDEHVKQSCDGATKAGAITFLAGGLLVGRYAVNWA
jgi:hypothetical protein